MKHHFKSFYVAGFSYYSGAELFNQLTIGSKLKIKLDRNNKYDPNAVTIKFKGKKIGYIPKSDNQEIAKLLKAGHKIFDAVIQQVSPEEHPENQVRVGVFTTP